MKFPSDFLWGSATAALQIEGATRDEGRGISVWEQFCQDHPERIFEQATPQQACDHFHRYREDVAWMKELGHSTYRFSIAWPRVVPEGRGAVNSLGLDFYERLVDELLEAGITPNITLYHWDLPLSLAQEGGWENPATVEAFVDYSAHCFERLGDRVSLWATINEPAWTVLNGYLTGLHPPCKQDRKAALLAAHHLLCAHGQVARLRPCGIALNLSPVYPARDTSRHREAAELADNILNGWFLGAVLDGSYPESLQAFYAERGLLPRSPHNLVKVKPAFLGVNYYYPHHAQPSQEGGGDTFHINNSGRPDDSCRFRLEGCFEFVRNPQGRYTDWAWEIEPDSLRDLLCKISARDPDLDLYVTENGIGLPDQLVEGEVDDSQRIEFVKDHLRAIWQARERGSRVKGYTMWSLLDNFSWINGYKKRYGFLYVDRQTMQRTPKKSAYWFRDLARSGVLE